MLADAAVRAPGVIIAKTRHLKYLGYNTYTRIFESRVVPALNYSSETWGLKQFKNSDVIQSRAIRYYLGVHRIAQISALRGEVGWHSIRLTIWLNMLKYWNMLTNLHDNRLTKKIFNWNFSLASNFNYINWSGLYSPLLIRSMFSWLSLHVILLTVNGLLKKMISTNGLSM